MSRHTGNAFRGAEIADPKGLLEATGKFMRHVKLRPEAEVDDAALLKLIDTAYTDMKGRLKVEWGEAGTRTTAEPAARRTDCRQGGPQINTETR
jgi:hypothetical protein